MNVFQRAIRRIISLVSDPTSPSNGDIWYNSTSNLLKARINGASTSLSGGGGGITNSALVNQVAISDGTNIVGDSDLVFVTDTLTATKLGATTLTGTVAGGGQQLNNIIIGTITPLAGSFTALTATSVAVAGAGAGLVDMTEGAAPSGSASHDLLYADSTAHALMMNNNNGGAVAVLGSMAQTIAGDQTFSGKIITKAGTTSSPGVSFAGSGGLYCPSAGYLGVSDGGSTIGFYFLPSAATNQFVGTSTTQIGWTASSSSAFVAMDTGLARNAARLLEINNGTVGTFGDLKVRQHYVDQTITAGGTTGNQTINKAAGTVNIAAAGTTVTVTNNLCTTSSTVFAVLRTNDATATIKNVVSGAGSFVITLTAGATAEVSIGFLVVNQ